MRPAQEPLLAQGPPVRSDHGKRLLQFAKRAAAATADNSWDERLDKIRPYVEQISQPLFVVAGWYWWLAKEAYAVYKTMPMDVVKMVFGAALCFFGGTYTVSIAAIEAFRNMGGQYVYADLALLFEQGKIVGSASRADDAKDEDHDGIADVDQIPTRQLVERKFKLGMAAVTEPERLVTAVGSLWSAYLAILATLRLEFARTTALAMGIAEMLEFPMLRILAPFLTAAFGPELKHWVKTSVVVGIKVFAIIFAWYMQMVISAFYSALRGGFMFAEGFFNMMVEKGWISMLPDFLVGQKDEHGCSKPFDPDDSYLDEAVAYSMMLVGIYMQLETGFMLPFPLDLIFLPLSIVEWVLRWQVTWGL